MRPRVMSSRTNSAECAANRRSVAATMPSVSDAVSDSPPASAITSCTACDVSRAIAGAIQVGHDESERYSGEFSPSSSRPGDDAGLPFVLGSCSDIWISRAAMRFSWAADPPSSAAAKRILLASDANGCGSGRGFPGGRPRRGRGVRGRSPSSAHKATSPALGSHAAWRTITQR
jgi:hypothetical protein